ncbi:MAG: DUF177 domain-containing protein [Burkholderiales bacterium]|nr:DUF177 domain-containing protein [Burkholderiales bacterium]
MKHRPLTFDAFRLAREGGVLEGTLDVAAASRLADRVSDRIADGAATVDWRIEGANDVAGRPALLVSLRGIVPLTCQRCLSEFALPVEQQTMTVLARSEADADTLDADSDDEVLVADHPMDPVGLIEDELLLTLPYAPMHDVGACVVAGGEGTRS